MSSTVPTLQCKCLNCQNTSFVPDAVHNDKECLKRANYLPFCIEIVSLLLALCATVPDRSAQLASKPDPCCGQGQNPLSFLRLPIV